MPNLPEPCRVPYQTAAAPTQCKVAANESGRKALDHLSMLDVVDLRCQITPGPVVTYSEPFRRAIHHVHLDNNAEVYSLLGKWLFRSVLTAGEAESGFVRATAPPRNVAESAAGCPQAFSRPQDSHSSHTINHDQNSSSWSTRHVFLCIHKDNHCFLSNRSICPELLMPVRSPHDLSTY